MKIRPFILHALSPLHAGTGQTPDVIDLPIARMKATGIPFLPATSIKGVLREARSKTDEEKTMAVFGPPSDESDAHAGALVVSDARLLALPVRSFRGTFTWVTSPLLLTLAKRDLLEAGLGELPIPSIEGRGACIKPGEHACLHNNHLYLEDLDLPARRGEEAGAWAESLKELVSPGDDIFSRRFAIVDDNTMSFLWETATQVDARVRIDEETRTVQQGALWLEESLPPETLLIGLFAADRSRRYSVKMSPDEVLNFVLSGQEIHQFGGKATTGRGRCRIVPFAQKGGRNG